MKNRTYIENYIENWEYSGMFDVHMQKPLKVEFTFFCKIEKMSPASRGWTLPSPLHVTSTRSHILTSISEYNVICPPPSSLRRCVIVGVCLSVCVCSAPRGDSHMVPPSAAWWRGFFFLLRFSAAFGLERIFLPVRAARVWFNLLLRCYERVMRNTPGVTMQTSGPVHVSASLSSMQHTHTHTHWNTSNHSTLLTFISLMPHLWIGPLSKHLPTWSPSYRCITPLLQVYYPSGSRRAKYVR